MPAIRHVLFPVLIVILMSGNAGFLRGQISDSRIQLLTEKAQAAQRSENTEEAIKAYEEILRIRPHWAPAELNLGVMYHLEKKRPGRYPDSLRGPPARFELDSGIPVSWNRILQHRSVRKGTVLSAAVSQAAAGRPRSAFFSGRHLFGP